jgi:hypothetical protein
MAERQRYCPKKLHLTARNAGMIAGMARIKQGRIGGHIKLINLFAG